MSSVILHLTLVHTKFLIFSDTKFRLGELRMYVS